MITSYIHTLLPTQAADMRAADEKRCASGTLAQQEAEKAARDSHHSDAIDLTATSTLAIWTLVTIL